MTTTDALIQAGDQLTSVLQKAEPESELMKKAVKALVNIFKMRAEAEQTVTDTRRQQRSTAQQQRVATEIAQQQRVPEITQDGDSQRVLNPEAEEEQEADDAVLMPGLEVTYPSLKDAELNPPTVTQDEDGPSQNTRLRHRQRLLSAIEASGACPSPKQAAARCFPLHFLVDLAAAVLD